MSDWIIGIDPSASKNSVKNAIGWAVLKDDLLYAFGELEPDAPFFSRTRMWLRNKFKMIHISDKSPNITVAVESAYLGKNPNVFLGMIQCQSHICAATLDAGHSFHYITPLDSFKAATGLTQYPKNEEGRRTGTRKPAIQAALRETYELTDQEISEHVFDALAIAVAIRNQQKREHH